MNIFLRNLPRKSFKNPDELERVLKSYVAGARVTGDDSEGFTLQALEEDGKHTYKIHLISDGGSSERVTVERVEQLNSKDNMNYYAKLVEKRNSTVSRGTVHGHKYEVDRMSDGSYIGYVYDEEDFPIFKTGLHSTAAGAEQEIKGKVFNSKENAYQPLWSKEKLKEFNKTAHQPVDPDKSMVELQKSRRLVQEFQKKGYSKEQIKRYLVTQKGMSDTLAGQSVDTWYNEKEPSYYEKIIDKKNATFDTEKLAKEVKKWLSADMYTFNECVAKLEKEYNMPHSVAFATANKGKKEYEERGRSPFYKSAISFKPRS